MNNFPEIEEIEISLSLPIGNPERFQKFQDFLNKSAEFMELNNKTVLLDFKQAFTGELCAYYEDSCDYAFYFDDWYLKSLISKYGTMMGSIQSFDGNDLFNIKLGLKVFPKELAKAILSTNTESVVNEDEDSYFAVSHNNYNVKEYDPHFEVFNLTDYKGKTIKNSNLCLSIVGTEYHDEYDEVQVGVTLTIKPDYDNIYDENALGYYTDDDTLVGYLPKREQAIARLFMAEGKLEAKVYNINGKFIDTVVQLYKNMVDITEADGLGFMLVKKEKKQGVYSVVKGDGSSSPKRIREFPDPLHKTLFLIFVC